MKQTIRTIIVIMIALVMVVPMIAGSSEVSYAASVTGAKATNYGFRMVRVKWNAVKVEMPQEPVAPSESEEPAESENPETSGNLVEAADSQVDVEPGISAEPSDPVTLTGQVSDSSGEPATDSSSESAADSEAFNRDGKQFSETVDLEAAAVDPNLGSEADPAPNQETVPTDEQSADPISDPVSNPAGAPADNPVSNSAAVPVVTMDMDVDTEPEAEPVYDVITYKVYRATAKKGKYKLITTTKATAFIDKGLTIGKKYFYKVIAYRSNGEEFCTSAIVSIKVAKQSVVHITLLKKGSAAFNYRIEAKQKLFQYDTLQGGCANSGYAYLTLYNRKVERCKIVKVKLSNLSIVKVSAVLPIYHGNNLTYNTRKKQIVATCCTTDKTAKYRVVMINPKTLKVVSIKNVDLKKNVKNLPKKVKKKNAGYSAVAYNEKHNCYVARLRQNGNVVILNKDLKPLRYVVLQGKKTCLVEQGIETVGDYIYDVRSFKGKYNYCMVTVHTMTGKLVGQLKFPCGTDPKEELECIFHNGKQFYAGIFYSTVLMDDKQNKRVDRVTLIQKLNNL